MKINTDKLTEELTEARPNVKPNTIKQYEIQLNKLKKVFEADNWDFLSKPEDVVDKLKGNKYTSQRNSYNAIIVLLMALNSDNKYDDLLEAYGKLRDTLNDKYVKDQQSGKISDKQKENFADLSEIKGMISQMESEIKSKGLKTKSKLLGKEKELLMVYVIYSLLIRLPIRNDMAGMELITKTQYNKLSEDQKKTTNYLVKEKNNMFLVLNEYKTSKKYGEKKIDIPKDLIKIFRMYIKLTNKEPGDVLFVSSTGNPISRNAMSQLLLKTSKKYMGKGVSTTLMRKAVVSDKFGDMKKEQAELADIMGHSVGVQNAVYNKEA
jgi:integrase